MSDVQEREEIDQATGEVLTRDQVVRPPVVTAEMSVVSAEINQQIATARRFPRRPDKTIALEIVGRATLNEEIARECFYTLSRKSGGESKDIVGPSIRLAEIVMASYGNIRVAARYVRIDDQDRNRVAVVVEAVAMDMQTNHAVLKQVRRSIMTSPKNGAPRMFTADMVNVTIMAAQSIAQRDAVLQLVPKALWIDGYHAARDVVKGDIATLNERRAKVIAGFEKAGIKPAELFAALGIESEQEIGLDDMPTLAGMWTALKEGESKDAVLGRVAEERGAAPGPVKNPLADRPATSGGTVDVTAEVKAAGPRPIPEANPASNGTTNEAAKSNAPPADTSAAAGAKPAQARQEPQDAPKAEAAAGTAAEPEKRATDAPAQAATALKGDAYLQGGLVFIANATSATGLKDWWKRERKTGREAADLTPKQIDALEDAYQDKLAALQGGA